MNASFLSFGLSLALLAGISSTSILAGIKLGEVPPSIKLSGDLGGRLTGADWASEELKGKVHVLFYVDPDEKDLNDHAAQALKAEAFPLDAYTSIAIINMAATWKPNFAIESRLEEKQKEFPHTIYVKDFQKLLVKQWQLADDSSDVVVFDKDGKVVFVKMGKLADADVAQLVQVVRANLSSR
jgi:YtfJ family uncharacterized protein